MIGLTKVGAIAVVIVLSITLATKRDKAREARNVVPRMLGGVTGSQEGNAQGAFVLPADLALSPAAGPAQGHRLQVALDVGSSADPRMTGLGRVLLQWSKRRRAKRS